MRDNLFQEYDIKKAEGEHRVPDYSYNVERMQVCMRKKGYLCHPELEDDLTSLSGKLLDENLLNLKTISREQRQENVLKVMQSNDFVISLNSRRIDIIKDQSTIPENDYDKQAKIMIISEITQKYKQASTSIGKMLQKIKTVCSGLDRWTIFIFV